MAVTPINQEAITFTPNAVIYDLSLSQKDANVFGTLRLRPAMKYGVSQFMEDSRPENIKIWNGEIDQTCAAWQAVLALANKASAELLNNATGDICLTMNATVRANGVLFVGGLLTVGEAMLPIVSIPSFVAAHPTYQILETWALLDAMVGEINSANSLV